MNKRKGRRIAKKNVASIEIEKAVQRMMMGAIAHQRTSVYCRGNPDATPPNIDSVYFLAVAFELILLSIEQSLKALLLIQHSILRTNHNIFNLYNEATNKKGRKAELQSDLLGQVNYFARLKDIETIQKGNVRACLKKHDSSYTNFRYFDLDNKGRITNKWEVKEYEFQVLDCLASALLEINRNEMSKRRYASSRINA